MYYYFKSSVHWSIETLICLLSLFPFYLGLFLGPTWPWFPLYYSFNPFFSLSLSFGGCRDHCDYSSQDGVQESTVSLSPHVYMFPLSLSAVHYFSGLSFLPKSVEVLKRRRRTAREALFFLAIHLSIFCKSFLFLFFF